LRFQSDTASTERNPACHFATTAQSFSNKHLDFNNMRHDVQAAFGSQTTALAWARRAKLCHVWYQQSESVSVHLDPLGPVRAWRKLYTASEWFFHPRVAISYETIDLKPDKC